MRRRCSYWAVPAVVASLALVLTPTRAGAQAESRLVLTIHGGPEFFPGNENFDASIREVLLSQPGVPIDYYAEYFENEEFGEIASVTMAESIKHKFAGRRIDLVIANTVPTVRFVLRYRDELFRGVPLVFAAAAPPPELIHGPRQGITGVVRDASHTETLELALKMHPATKEVLVLAYAPEVDGFDDRIRASVTTFANRVKLTFTREPTLAEALKVVKALPPDSLIFYVRYSPARLHRTIYPDEFLSLIAEVAPVPIYSGLDSNLGRGVVGGMMRSGGTTARRLASMALEILGGKAPESMPIESVQLAPIFDWREMRRWGIDESRLPPGADIRFRVPTLWESYRGYIVSTIVVVFAQSLLIAGLLTNRARRRKAEAIVRAREAALRSSYERIRTMAGRLINAQEAARADIARDLHDDVCQKLAYVSIGVNSLRTATGDIQEPRTQQIFEELERDTRSTFDGIRRLSHDLHPATLRLLGLGPALRSHCAEFQKRHGVPVTFNSNGDLGRIHPDVSVGYFRMAQESLRNAIQHGAATHLTVALSRTGDRLDLSVADDGGGFDIAAVQKSGGGLGLVTMEERANLVGGVVTIISEVGRGTTVRIQGPADLTAPTASA